MAQLIEQHYDNAEEAAEGAREKIAAQYAPFGLEPKVYTVEACGLKAVCLPWGHSKQTLALKRAGGAETVAQQLAIAEARFTDTLFWIEGQQEPGPAAARKWAKGLADLGGAYGALIFQIVAKCAEQEAGAAGAE